jgi:hypothetical protein
MPNSLKPAMKGVADTNLQNDCEKWISEKLTNQAFRNPKSQI